MPTLGSKRESLSRVQSKHGQYCIYKPQLDSSHKLTRLKSY